MRVLVVEDESTIARPLRRALEREGYSVSLCETGHNALRLARTWSPDVILLDLLLPDMDGRDVAREIRTRSPVPIIMVTARGEEADRVAGLEIGADDYVVKPFSVPELIARMRAVARRTQQSPEPSATMLTFKDLRLDLSAYRAFKGDVELDLTNKEFELLRILLMRPGTLVRRDEVVRAVWNMSLAESGKTLDVHMSGLRRKLGDEARHPTYIETVRSVGFRLVGAA
ncbi:MAG: response regulator transcription factor [Actinomycetota bacterium]